MGINSTNGNQLVMHCAAKFWAGGESKRTIGFSVSCGIASATLLRIGLSNFHFGGQNVYKKCKAYIVLAYLSNLTFGVHTHTREDTCTHTRRYVHTHAETRAHTRKDTCTHTRRHVHTHTKTRAHTYVDIHAHMHIQQGYYCLRDLFKNMYTPFDELIWGGYD